MKLGILSDIHGDLVALELAWSHLVLLGADRIVSAGDAVGYGPRPDETVEFLRARSIACVRGNHDRWAIERGPLARDPFGGAAEPADDRIPSGIADEPRRRRHGSAENDRRRRSRDDPLRYRIRQPLVASRQDARRRLGNLGRERDHSRTYSRADASPLAMRSRPQPRLDRLGSGRQNFAELRASRPRIARSDLPRRRVG